ncbi:hypothetical protein BKA69DRAFT_1042202 [Paraphysoderma sedebokerense]|nr:hypothetical protein BKA69DRAFT_1042202 [Paraphysoderma sedebokerense]
MKDENPLYRRKGRRLLKRQFPPRPNIPQFPAFPPRPNFPQFRPIPPFPPFPPGRSFPPLPPGRQFPPINRPRPVRPVNPPRQIQPPPVPPPPPVQSPPNTPRSPVITAPIFTTPPAVPDPIISPPPNILPPPALIAFPIEASPTLSVIVTSSINLVITTSTQASEQATAISKISFISSSTSLATSIPSTVILPTALPKSSTESSTQPNSDDSDFSAQPYIIIGVVSALMCIAIVGLFYRYKRKSLAAVNPSLGLSTKREKTSNSFNQSPARRYIASTVYSQNSSHRDSVSSFKDTKNSWSEGSASSNHHSSNSKLPGSTIKEVSQRDLNSFSTLKSTEDGSDIFDGFSRRQEILIFMQCPTTANSRQTIARPRELILHSLARPQLSNNQD